ncbi:MAG: DUF1501 domain-containing protein [Planctomycetia bacterium]|nr:DUF1501 domain-containing protein [Planctomycetia bacterium]
MIIPTGQIHEQPDRFATPRRTFLANCATGLAGWGASSLLGAGTARAAPARRDSSGQAGAGGASIARAKSLIVLFLYGAPSQMDTLDPKPHAPAELRGEFQSISTSLPGIAASELLPNVARNLHRVCLVRSMTHASNNHAVSVALSGLRDSSPEIEGNGKDARHQPYFGSVLEYLWKQQGIGAEMTGMPVHMVLPWALNQKTDKGRWQHHAAWLGREYNPVIPVFRGQGSLETGAPSIAGVQPILTRFDPWDGVTPASTFAFEGTSLPADVPQLRFESRLQFLNAVDGALSAGATRQGQSYEHHRQLALAMMTDPRVTRALDVTQEPLSIREQYGYTMFGQCALAARRLVQAGVKLVTVFWDTWTDNNAAWDTHHNHHPRLKQGLCPKFDQILPAFLDDMESRGLLDETLVLVISEHGRTPAITTTPGGGREHWAGAYWGMFFGAGIRTGQVLGATDRVGGYPVSMPTHPNDILATVYHLFGFDPHATAIPDRLGRPIPLTEGDVVRDMLA